MFLTLALNSLLISNAEAGMLGSLRMPLTPHGPRTEFHGLVKKKRASTVTWTSRTPGFVCTSDGDFVEVRVAKATWPGTVPDRIWCDSDLGSVKMKVEIWDERLVSMFVGDGTLVLARAYGESADYEGPVPRHDVIVQQGNTGDTGLYCKIKPGPVLHVRAKQTTEDTQGSCVVRTSAGESYAIPIVLRSTNRDSGRR